MRKRFKMGKKRSRRLFTKTARRVNRKNVRGITRGGFRL